MRHEIQILKEREIAGRFCRVSSGGEGALTTCQLDVSFSSVNRPLRLQSFVSLWDGGLTAR